MRTENRASQMNGKNGFEALESRQLFSAALATQDVAAPVAAEAQIEIDMPLGHAARPATSAAYRAAAEMGESAAESAAIALTPRWTAIITVIGGDVSVSGSGIAPRVYVASGGNPFGGYENYRLPHGHASSPVPLAANQNGPTTPVADADGGSADKTPASTGSGASSAVAVPDNSAAHARAGSATAPARAAASSADVAVAALAASTNATSRSRAALSASAGREPTMDKVAGPVDQRETFVGFPSAAPGFAAAADGARASFSSSLIGINSFLPATPVVPADGVRAQLPAEDLAAAEQASLARAAGKSLPDRLYYFARIDPMRTFADALAAFANESARSPESQRAGNAWAWGVTAVVGLADAAVLAWWHASRRKEARRRQAQFMRHSYGPHSLVRRRIAPAN